MNEEMLSVFVKPPTLETDRLRLRKIVVSDYKDMFDYSRRPETSRYLLWTPHDSPKFTKRYIAYLQGQYRDENFYDFALEYKESGKMIGTCGFTCFDLENNAAEVGYVLHPDFWHMGLAPEALLRLMAFGFSELRLHRLVAKIMDENDASKRVAAKCGFRHEATHKDAMLIKGEFRTISEYAILSREYFGGLCPRPVARLS
ncbi:MAG: GNAT family N-acetyltransferase [Clostridia bacterium]|nr:GNAT family N-acetyltransferase [Clostridia bacterium]